MMMGNQGNSATQMIEQMVKMMGISPEEAQQIIENMQEQGMSMEQMQSMMQNPEAMQKMMQQENEFIPRDMFEQNKSDKEWMNKNYDNLKKSMNKWK
jgi:polyhydroxyalkanoate synthesis regulator phasin